MSYILMTEHSTGQARSVRDLLKRLKTPIPRELAAMLAGMKQVRESTSTESHNASVFETVMLLL